MLRHSQERVYRKTGITIVLYYAHLLSIERVRYGELRCRAHAWSKGG